jgi:fatty-acyl-CoA synthase
MVSEASLPKETSMSSEPADAARAHASGRSFEHLNDLLVQALRTYADVELLHTWAGASFTGAQIESEVARRASALERLGVGLGTHVALLAGNSPEVLFAQQAIGVLGGVFVPLHPMGTPSDFAHILEDAEVEFVLVDLDRTEEIAQAVTLSRSAARVLTLGGKDDDDLVRLAANEQATRITLRYVDPEAICRVVYTGGTTGVPKASQVSFRSLSTMYGIQIRDWQWPEEIRHLLVAPLSHSGAVCFIPTIAQGGVLYIAERFDVVGVLSAIERHRITCILLVPTMISAILDHPRLNDFDVSSLRAVFYGASPISPTRLRAAIAHFGPVFFQFYGQAEAPTTVAIMRREEHDVSSDRRLASCGRPVPEAQVRLVDSDGQQVSDGEPGEICVRGPLVMSGYLNRPADTAEAFRGGWLHTGDVAVRDPDGFLRIVDRAKELVITGGFNVYPRVIEDVLEDHPSVAAACVVGVPDDYWGELLVAAVILRDEDTTASELMDHVRERKGPVQTPKRIEIVSQLPITAVGKRNKKEVRRLFMACVIDPRDVPATEEEQR